MTKNLSEARASLDKSLLALEKNSQTILDELSRMEPAENEVYSTHSIDLRVVFEAKDFNLSASHETSMYGVRSLTGGRVGFTTTNALDPENIRQLSRETQALARLSPKSEHQVIAREGEIRQGNHELLDSALVDLPAKDLYTYAEMAVAEASKDSRVTIDRIEMSWSLNARLLMNSNGYRQSALQSSCSWFAMGMAKTANEVTSFDYDGASVADKDSIESSLCDSLGRFRESVVGSLGARRGKTYKGKVLLHPSAAMSFLGGLVTANANGLRQQDGMSSWKDLLGQKVISPSLNVFADPLDRSRVEGWLPFDREGNVTSRQDLIRSGILNFIGHNCFSAHRAQVRPTGNSTGGASSLPGVGFFNLGITGSDNEAPLLSEESLLKELGVGLVIKRFSGNMDPISGQISGIAKNSWWVENGERAHPVQEVMIAGSLFEIAKQIVAVGEKPMALLGGGLAPYILVDGLSVTAG